MSDMFDYNNVSSLLERSMDWSPIDHWATQHYALKFIFGELDLARRQHASAKSLKKNKIYLQRMEKRIAMLKMLAATIRELDIQPPIDSSFVKVGCEKFAERKST